METFWATQSSEAHQRIRQPVKQLETEAIICISLCHFYMFTLRGEAQEVSALLCGHLELVFPTGGQQHMVVDGWVWVGGAPALGNWRKWGKGGRSKAHKGPRGSVPKKGSVNGCLSSGSPPMGKGWKRTLETHLFLLWPQKMKSIPFETTQDVYFTSRGICISLSGKARKLCDGTAAVLLTDPKISLDS